MEQSNHIQSNHIQRGKEGEQAVAVEYQRRGYEVVARNWRAREGELDLVCFDALNSTIVFCEVKTRSSSRFGGALEAVDQRRVKRLRNAAARYLAEHKPHISNVRFDVAAVDAKTLGIQIVEAAF